MAKVNTILPQDEEPPPHAWDCECKECYEADQARRDDRAEEEKDRL